MSKRYGFPTMQGQAKRAKLDITVLDHKFPMSQNKQDDFDNNWGDDNDDEMLLLASQACEAYTTEDISDLPDISLNLQPGFTSTPIEPGTSKNFTFKKPNQGNHGVLSTDLKNKCSKINSPLHGISCSIPSTINCKEDFIVNGVVCNDCGHVYKQLLEIKNDNVKLRSENGMLLEKCVTNDGEVSILRSQLKSCQVAVDNARMEKVRAQERVEMDYMQRLTVSKNETRDLRTQLDFKNLEVISLKEKCKMLESSKIKLTQVTLAGNDVSMSQRHHNNTVASTYQPKKKVTSAAVQTCDKKKFLKLNKRYCNETNKLKDFLSIILQDSTQKELSLVLKNEKLRKSHDFNQTKCRVFSTFNRIPTTPAANKNGVVIKLTLKNLHEDLCAIASNKGFSEAVRFRYINVFTGIHKILAELVTELECITHRITTAFQKEMDDKYLDTTSVYTHFSSEQLLCGISLYKEEQGILARRALAILSYVITCQKSAQLWTSSNETEVLSSSLEINNNSFQIFNRICKFIDSSSCAVLYSGFLLSLLSLLERIYKYLNTTEIYNQFKEIIKYIVTSRPMPVVSCKILIFLRKLAIKETALAKFCLHMSPQNNLNTDCDQKAMLHKKDSCILQFFLKQIEISLMAFDEQTLVHLVSCTQNLLGLYGNILSSKPNWIQDNSSNRCNCSTVMIQVVVYSLYICSSYLNKIPNTHGSKQNLEAICRCGVNLIYQLVMKDLEFTQLGYNEEHYYIFIENCNKHKDDIILDELQGNMLTELMGTLLPPDDCDTPSTQCKQIWIDSFKNFVIAD